MASNKDAELETPLLMPEEEEGPTAPLQDQGSPEPTPRPRLPPPKFGELITVLSIDGGGIHGLIPTVVLKCLEEKLQVSQPHVSLEMLCYVVRRSKPVHLR